MPLEYHSYFKKSPYQRSLVSLYKLNILQNTKLKDLIQNYKPKSTWKNDYIAKKGPKKCNSV